LNIVSFYKSFYLTKRTYITGAVIAFVFALAFYIPVLMEVGKLLLLALVIIVLLDLLLLYSAKKNIAVERYCNERFNIGEDNEVAIDITNEYGFDIHVILVDEIPVQFNEARNKYIADVKRYETAHIKYMLKPFERGAYTFDFVHALITSPLAFVCRKISTDLYKEVKVYPSVLHMRKYSLHAVSNQLQDVGSKQLRKTGHSMEFEQIKEYVRGDDYRTLNWKASARKGQLMVNTFTDEKSQQVYCLLDKSRSMKMPFDGLTLLDHAIHASLVLTNVSLQKQDKAGLLSFAQKVDTFVPADRKGIQMEAVLEALYAQQTKFLDADYESLYAYVRTKIKQRSLLVLFTNFESLYSLQRQLPYLKKMAHYHLLMVVFFENTGIRTLLNDEANNTEEIYIKTIAEKFAFEKRQMVKELQQNGILAILTTPEQLTVNTINKYLEVKTRQMI
jgi:uncharacterized protein (DUF58 family)